MVTIFTLFFNVLELEILLYDNHATKTAFVFRKRSGRISDKINQPFTTSCFRTNSGSKTTPNPGPVGTLTNPFTL